MWSSLTSVDGGEKVIKEATAFRNTWTISSSSNFCIGERLIEVLLSWTKSKKKPWHLEMYIFVNHFKVDDSMILSSS